LLLADDVSLDHAVLAGVTTRGLAFVTTTSEVEVPCRGTREQLAALVHGLAVGMSEDVLVRRLGGWEASDLAPLREHGILRNRRTRATSLPDTSVLPLADALLATRVTARLVLTRDEALVLPEHLPPELVARALRAFVGGIQPPLRLELYGYCASAAVKTVAGDLPRTEQMGDLKVAAAALDPELVHTVDLVSGATNTTPPEEILEPQPKEGRLRIVTHVTHSAGPGGLTMAVARHACPDLRFAHARSSRAGFGIAPAAAEAVATAAAEAVERFACGNSGPAALNVARGDALAGAVDPHRLGAFSEHQYARLPYSAYRDDRDYVWSAASTSSGESRWVPADFVYAPFRGPGDTRPLFDATTSGVAAGVNAATATRRALLEVIERDAFMWTWLQQVQRETIAPTSLPRAARAQLEVLGAEGWRMRLINLTLDTKPVVLAVATTRDGAGLGLAAGDVPAEAVERAVREAVASWQRDRVGPPFDVARVRTPADHRALYRSPAARAAADFLWTAEAEIPLAEIAFDDAPAEQIVADRTEPLFVQLAGDDVGGLVVIRALVPDMIPITFGYDREPLGMPRAARALALLDGRTVGRARRFGAPPLPQPHPFA
jgi:thiazole/oxazole-forming peptide maturase SagD family component